MPLAYCTMAPGEGQALRQPGSSQCMQPSLRISHSRLPFGFSYFGKSHHRPGLLRQIGRVVVHAAVGADLIAQIVPLHAGDLAGLAADALGGVDELGDLAGVAHRGHRAVAWWWRSGARYRAIAATWDLLSFLDLDQERLELGRLRVGVADRGGKRIGQEAGFGDALESPVDGYADRDAPACRRRSRALMRLVTIATALM